MPTQPVQAAYTYNALNRLAGVCAMNDWISLGSNCTAIPLEAILSTGYDGAVWPEE